MAEFLLLVLLVDAVVTGILLAKVFPITKRLKNLEDVTVTHGRIIADAVIDRVKSDE